MRKVAKIAAQLLISLVFLYIAFRSIRLNELKEAVRHVHYVWLIPGIALQFLSYAVRGVRWKALLHPIKPVSFASSFYILTISYAANNTLPFRAGDILRAVMIGQKERVSKLSSFSTVLLEKMLDGLTVILFLIVGLVFLPTENEWSKRTIVISAAAFAGVLLFLYLVKRLREPLIRFLSRTAGRLGGERVSGMAGSLLQKCLVSLDLIESRSLILTLIWTSLVVWLLEGSLYMFTAYAFGLPLSLSLWAGLVTVAVVNMGIMIPSTPGYVGTFEFFCVFSMSLFGIEPGLAASFSILVHLAMYVPITVFGAAAWLIHSFDRKAEEQTL